MRRQIAASVQVGGRRVSNGLGVLAGTVIAATAGAKNIREHSRNMAGFPEARRLPSRSNFR
jgi:hypothetical protein